MAFIRMNKTLLLGIGLAVLITIGYFVFFKSDGTTAPLQSEQVSENGGNDTLLRTLLTLRSLSLDTGIFSSQPFQSLKDFGVALPAQPVGRTNPFAPLNR